MDSLRHGSVQYSLVWWPLLFFSPLPLEKTQVAIVLNINGPISEDSMTWCRTAFGNLFSFLKNYVIKVTYVNDYKSQIISQLLVFNKNYSLLSHLSPLFYIVLHSHFQNFHLFLPVIFSRFLNNMLKFLHIDFQFWINLLFLDIKIRIYGSWTPFTHLHSLSLYLSS